jgi:hypothetical protein
MPRKLLDPADIIVISWRNFYRHWRVYAEFTAWIAFISIIFWVLGVLTRSLVPDRMLASFIFALMSLPLSLFLGVIIAGVIDATAKTLQSKPADTRASLAVGIHKLIPFIWVSIMVTAAVIFGFLLLIVPALIFSVWFAFAANFLIVDDVRGSAALKASKALVAGRWWAVLFRTIVPWLIFFFAVKFALALAYLLLGAVFGDPGMFFGTITDIYSLTNLHLLVTTVVPQIFYGLGLPLFLGANLALWYDLKRPG